MQEETTSIFDEEFLSGLLIQRRSLMPTALKVYIWVYIILSGLDLLICTIATIDYSIGLIVMNIIPPAFISFGSFLLFSIVFIFNLFIWLERKWSIALTLALTWLVILIKFIIDFPFTDGTTPFYMRFDVWVIAITIPYLIMLWQIKDKWEKGIRSGKR